MKTLYKMAVILLVLLASGYAYADDYGGQGDYYDYDRAFGNQGYGFDFYGQGRGYGDGRYRGFQDPHTQIGGYADHPAGTNVGAYERHMDTQYGPCWRHGERGMIGRDC